MIDEREVRIDHANGWRCLVTVAASAFDDKAMMAAVESHARDWEVGFPWTPGLRRGQIVTITVPHWEFQVRARVLSVKDTVVRFREVKPSVSAVASAVLATPEAS
jgi:hypothetical protein